MELTGRILTEGGLREGTVRFDRHIRTVELRSPGSPGQPAPTDRSMVLPGFVDAHAHGGGRGDTMEGEEGLRCALRAHARAGTTTLVPTTLTESFARIEAALVGIQATIDRPEPEGSQVVGAHLEGPWIAASRLGAQPARARSPESWEVDRLLELAPIRVVTLAPEIEGGLDLIDRLVAEGIRVQVGHSDADAATTREALDRGAAGFTHLFNAMREFHHREPGMVGVALAAGRSAELILDGHHLRREALEIARRCLPDWYCVSDATAAAGAGDGLYRLGSHAVTCREGACRLEDGTLAGSASTLLDGLRRAVAWGVPIEEAAARVSTVPARALGLFDRGRIEAGARADLVVLSPDLEIESVWVEGRPIVGDGNAGEAARGGG